jgi:hypothetical protein
VAEREFEVSVVVPVAPEVVIDFLTDLAKHRGLHPFLVEAAIVSEVDSPEGPCRQWLVRERLHVGPLSYRLRFIAGLTRTSATSFTSHVQAAPGCTIDSVTSAGPGVDPFTSQVREVSVVRAPAGLLGYMARNAEIAHRRTMSRLPDVLADEH